MNNKILDKKAQVFTLDKTSKNMKEIKEKIKTINAKRLFIFGLLTSFLEVLLILFNDMPALMNPKHGGGIDQAYFSTWNDFMYKFNGGYSPEIFIRVDMG